MKTRKNPHIGSDFDDFLREQGIFEQVERASAKELIANHCPESDTAVPRTTRTSVRTTAE